MNSNECQELDKKPPAEIVEELDNGPAFFHVPPARGLDSLGLLAQAGPGQPELGN